MAATIIPVVMLCSTPFRGTWDQIGLDHDAARIATSIMAAVPNSTAVCSHHQHTTPCNITACLSAKDELPAAQAAAAVAQGGEHPVWQSPGVLTTGDTGPCPNRLLDDRCLGIRTTWGNG